MYINLLIFIKHICNLTIYDNEVLLSLVVSLFIDVPIDLVIEGMERRWHLIERKYSQKRNFLKF